MKKKAKEAECSVLRQSQKRVHVLNATSRI